MFNAQQITQIVVELIKAAAVIIPAVLWFVKTR